MMMPGKVARQTVCSGGEVTNAPERLQDISGQVHSVVGRSSQERYYLKRR